MTESVTQPPEFLPRGVCDNLAKASKTQRKKRKGPQITPITRGRAGNNFFNVQLDEQGPTVLPPHSRYLRPFACFALTLASVASPSAIVRQLGTC